MMDSTSLNYTNDIHFDFYFYSTTGIVRILSLTETGIDYYNYSGGYPARIWTMLGTIN